MIDMTKPSYTASVSDIENMPEDKWLKLVGELAYPQRAQTMIKAVQLVKERDLKNIVETGCIRGWAGDGQSTLIFAMLAARLGLEFSTYDSSDVHLKKAREWLGPFAAYTNFNLGDSVGGLSAAVGVFDLVYLDSYDYDAANPRPCQLHQLAEVGAIYGKLTYRAVIMMDDADLSGGGKVAMSVDYLKNLHWKIVANEYQIILTR
jgi:hypothetical protein